MRKTQVSLTQPNDTLSLTLTTDPWGVTASQLHTEYLSGKKAALFLQVICLTESLLSTARHSEEAGASLGNQLPEKFTQVSLYFLECSNTLHPALWKASEDANES